MAIYHLHWRGTRDRVQHGWYIQDTHGTEWGRIEWTDGRILVVHNDGSLFRDCGISHGASFAAASDLIDFHLAAEARHEAREDDARKAQDRYGF